MAHKSETAETKQTEHPVCKKTNMNKTSSDTYLTRRRSEC